MQRAFISNYFFTFPGLQHQSLSDIGDHFILLVLFMYLIKIDAALLFMQLYNITQENEVNEMDHLYFNNLIKHRMDLSFITSLSIDEI